MAFILFLLVIAFRNLMQVALTAGKKKGKILAAAGTVSLYLCYILAFLLAVRRLYLQSGIDRTGMDGWFLAGFSFLLPGVILRIAGLKKLGRFYSSFVEIRETQKLVTDGLYSLVRHPLHLSYLMEVGGMALISASILSAIPFLASLLTILLRNRKEEEALKGFFGRDYEGYRNNVPSMNILVGIARKVRAWKKARRIRE